MDAEEDASEATAKSGPPSTEISDFLVQYARLKETGKEEDQKALLLALSVDPESEDAFKASYEFEQPSGLTIDDTIVVAALVTRGKGLLRDLESASSLGNDLLQARLADLLEVLAKDDADIAFSRHLTGKRNVAPSWDRFLYASNAKEIEENQTSAEFGQNQTQIYGLLVEDLETGRFAGKVSRMNATLSRKGGEKDLSVQFNQEVGEMMATALKEVEKFIQLRHPEKRYTGKVEVAFENQYSSKDGPSAAVACALLLDSLITGEEISLDIALTGDMNADGLVKPVGGIYGKIRGAEKAGRSIVAIPEKNQESVLDMMIASGPESICGIQIFSIGKFEEAYQLSRAEGDRPTPLKEALLEFSEIQGVLQKAGGMRFLKNPHVIERLKKVIELAPNHLSAKSLLLAGTGTVPSQLSLRGSLIQIDIAAEPLIRSIQSDNFDPQESPFADDEYAKSLSSLRRIRPMLDPRTMDCVDSLIDFSGLMREWVNNRPKSHTKIRELMNRINSAAGRVDSEYENIESDADIREELNQ